MAGIGFELRRLLRRGSYAGLIKGYSYAGLISSGPWVFAVAGMLLIHVLRSGTTGLGRTDVFQVSVTYLMAASLLFAGAPQLLFSRFVADRTFEGRVSDILPNLMGVLGLTTACSGALAAAVVLPGFGGSLLYRELMAGSFVVLCDLWLLVVLLSGLEEHRWILATFLLGYTLAAALSLALQGHGIEGLLAGFFSGQVVMLAASLARVARRCPAERLVAFDFLTRRQARPELALVGLCYNAGLWVDKLLFWSHPHTSEPVIGPLRASSIYDLPMFLAYLSTVPGMAVFFVRIEADFAERQARFYQAVRAGMPLSELERLKAEMVESIRRGLGDVVKVQGLVSLALLMTGPRLLRSLGLSPLHLQIYELDLVGVGTQVLLLATFSIFFYLDQRAIALGLSALLLGANAGLSLASLALGPPFYGYAFGLSVLLTTLAGLWLLSRKLERLEYETFMLQS